MKQKIIAIIFIVLTVGLTSAFLIGKALKKQFYKNGFTRTFNSYYLLKPKEVITTQKTCFIAGINGDTCYFHTSDPTHLYYADATFSKLDTMNLPISDDIAAKLTSGFSININYPFADILAYNLSGIMRYQLINRQLQIIRTPNNYINAVPVSDSLFLLKCFDSTSMNLSFYLLNSYTQQYRLAYPSKSEGLASTGILLYDTAGRKGIYVHHYQNKLYTIDPSQYIDTLLSTGKSWHTIDTFSHYQISYVNAQKTQSTATLYKAKGGRVLINHLARIYNGKLYINSAVKADNETVSNFSKNSVMDIYDLVTGQYNGSFYIPAWQDKKLLDFNIAGNYLIATYPAAIIKYLLPG